MRFRSRALLALFTAILAIWPLGAVRTVMPVKEVKAGMEGIGRTVFSGNTLEEFKVHILGVLENVMGPSRSLILARLEGGPLATTGVIAGMSGSPVYIDGRLVGAVSYSLGQFPREAIAGITPIDEMVDATGLPERRPTGTQAKLQLPITGATLAAVLQETFGRTSPFARSSNDLRFTGLGLDRMSGNELGAMLRPIATPLVMGGFGGDVADVIANGFASSGFMPVAGAVGGGIVKASSVPGATPPLRPGDPIGVGLVSGDLALGATGTVTDVVGDRVYAFGHPFYNLGPTRFPMTQAFVHVVLPSLMSSSKLASLGDVIGTIEQDRATAIAGTLGAAPSMLPITARARHGSRASTRVQVLRGPRSAVHAAADVLVRRQHAQVVRARVRDLQLHGEGPGAGRQARRDRVRGSLHGRLALDRRGQLHRRPDHVPPQ